MRHSNFVNLLALFTLLFVYINAEPGNASLGVCKMYPSGEECNEYRQNYAGGGMGGAANGFNGAAHNIVEQTAAVFKSFEQADQERRYLSERTHQNWLDSHYVDMAKEMENLRQRNEAERIWHERGRLAVEEFQKRKDKLVAELVNTMGMGTGVASQPEPTDNRRPPKPLSPTPQKISDYAIKSIELYNQATANGDDYTIQQAKAMMDAVALADRVPECDGCSDDNLWTYQWKKTNRYTDRAKRIYDYATNSPEIAEHNKAKRPNRYESILNIETFDVDSAVSAEAAIITRALIQKVIWEHRNDAGRILGGFSISQALAHAQKGLFEKAYVFLDIAWDVVDIAVGVMPGIGDVKDFCEAVTGWRSCIPGAEKLSTLDRIFAGAGLVVGSKATWKYSAKALAEALETAAQTAGRIAPLLKESVETVVKETFGKLSYLGKEGWRSPAGLIYGHDRVDGNKVWHVFTHLGPPLEEKHMHTEFKDLWHKILPMVDEGWQKRGKSYINKNRDVFEIDMERQIGRNSEETFLRLVVKKDSTEIISAYPISKADVRQMP